MKIKIYVMISSKEFIDPSKFKKDGHLNFIEPSTGAYSSHVINVSCFKSMPNFMDSFFKYTELEEDILNSYVFEGMMDEKKDIFIDFSKFVTMFINDSDMMSL